MRLRELGGKVPESTGVEGAPPPVEVGGGAPPGDWLNPGLRPLIKGSNSLPSD